MENEEECAQYVEKGTGPAEVKEQQLIFREEPGTARIARLAYLQVKELKHPVNDVKLKKATFNKVQTLINE